jgi:hypothetical protein
MSHWKSVVGDVIGPVDADRFHYSLNIEVCHEYGIGNETRYLVHTPFDDKHSGTMWASIREAFSTYNKDLRVALLHLDPL